MTRIGILGAGHEALRLLDALAPLEDVLIIGVCDREPVNLGDLAARVVGLDTFDRPEPLLALHPDTLFALTDDEALLAETRAAAPAGTVILPPAITRLWLASLDAQMAADGSAQMMDRRLLGEAADLLFDLSDLLRDLTADLDRATDALSQLSLNTTIEAARTGDRNSGFALVADDLFRVSTATEQCLDTARQLSRDLRERAERLRKLIS
jgi:hypothetical protein